MSKKKKNRFANIIIVLCIIVGLIITASILYEYHRLCIALPSEVLGRLLAFWGGELLIVALRQIFGSDITNKSKGEETGI